MLSEKNFPDSLQAMNFIRRGNVYEKIFADNVTMCADLNTRKLFYPTQLKGRDRNNFFDAEHKENLVVFECVNRLLDKGYRPEDIWLEKSWTLGHTQKSGRADICVSVNDKVLFIVECKTAGEEFKRELANMERDGGQLFSYWQQEQSCQWLVLYASDFSDGLKFDSASVPCGEKFYRDAQTVPERFKIWRERYDKKFLGDVIFHDETIAYKIGVTPLRKRDLKSFSENESVVNKFEEILRHNPVSNKANAFDVLIALFICKLADESQIADNDEVFFQFKDGSDTHETFQDRLQRLYRDGMEKFLKEKIDYVPLSRVDNLLRQINQISREELAAAIKYDYRRLKFFSPNVFALINVYNENLFYMNAKILREVVEDILRDYKIIGSTDLQTLGDLFEQLLDKGFKQNEGQFFTPTPIAQFIWDSLPLDEIIQAEPPKIIDYACGAAHFLTEGYKAVNDCFTRKNLSPPVMWERDKLFGVEKDPRLATVSKISFFMHGANEGKIKFGDGLEDYPDENISPETFDILVANPPYSVRGFKKYLRLTNEENFSVLDKISVSGSEIETLFAERISHLVKPRGVAAVILPSSILNKDGKSFVAARESLLKNFYVRAIVQLGSKTFGATGTNTVILFLQRIFDPPELARLFIDSANIILRGEIVCGDMEEEIFAAYLKKISVTADDYKKFVNRAVDFDNRQIPYFAAYADKFTPTDYKNLPADEQRRRNNQKFYDAVTDIERQKIIYFALTYRQRTLVVTAPDDVKAQEIFLGYGWSNAKGREGIVHKKRGGLLFDNDNRAADNTIAAVIRAAFRNEELHLPELEKFYRFATLADMLDFDATDFTKKITAAKPDFAPAEYTGNFPLVTLGDVCAINLPKSEIAAFDDATPVSFVEMASVSNKGYIVEKINRPLGEVRKGGYKYFAEGDIIVAKITPCMENGKCAIARGLTNSIGFGSTEFHVFRCRNEKILTEYLFAFLNREDIRQVAQSHMTGASGHRRVPESFYSKLLIPLPPLDVQKQIVDEFNALDAQIAAQDEMIRRLDADIQAKFSALFGDENFETRKIDDLFDLQIGKTPARDNMDYWSDGIHKWISVGDMGKYDRYTGDTAEKISQAAVDATGIKLVPAQTVIMSFKLTIGRTAITSEAIYTNEAIVAFLGKTKYLINAEYLRIYLQRHNWSRGQMQAVKGLTLNKQSIGRAAIPVPPLDLQEKFAAYVENCAAMKKSARLRREELTDERAELVTKYFR